MNPATLSFLQVFAQRPLGLDLDPQLQRCLDQCRACGLDQLPLPGQGHTLQRWRVLAEVAGADLALAKLFEGHTDALAIIDECAASHLDITGS